MFSRLLTAAHLLRPYSQVSAAITSLKVSDDDKLALVSLKTAVCARCCMRFFFWGGGDDKTDRCTVRKSHTHTHFLSFPTSPPLGGASVQPVDPGTGRRV